MKHFPSLVTITVGGWLLLTGLLLVRSATFGVRIVKELAMHQRIPAAYPTLMQCNQEFERLSEIDQQYCYYQSVEARCPNR